MKTLRTYPLILAAAALVGCGADASEYSPIPGECLSDVECSSGLVCRAGVCTVPDASTRALSFVFIPPPSSGYLPQRTPFYEITPAQRVDFALAPSIGVYGQIGSFNVDGTLVFTPSNSSDPLLRQQAAVTRGDYEISLIPGSYSINFISGTQGVPSRIWRNIRFENDVPHDLALPALSETVSITGNINFIDPTLDIGAGIGLARVTAVSQETGALSTTATTDPESGFYEGLRLWRNTGVYDVVVSPTDTTSLVPTVTFRGAIDTSDIPANAASFETNLFVGSFAAAERFVRLEFDEAAEAALGELDPSAIQVSLRATIETPSSDVEATFSLRSSVASRGDETAEPLRALPLRYVGELIPPAGSALAPTPIDLDLSALSTRVVQLPAMRTLDATTSRVVDFAGAPVAGARVTFTPLSKPSRKIAATFEANEARSFEVYTADDGSLSAYLDPQYAYDVRVDPQSMELPRLVFTAEPGEFDDTLELSAPSLIAGSVFADDSSSVSDVTVKIIERDDDEPERVIAEGATDEFGIFRIITPDDD